MSARPLALAAALALLAGAPRPCDAQEGGNPNNAMGGLSNLAAAMTSAPNALTASYSGALSFSGPQTQITASVTHGRVQCTGSMSTGDGGSTSYAGVGRIDLELGLSTEDDQGRRLNDLYRITLHCPMTLPGHEGHEGRSLADIANTAYQSGGRVSQSSAGGLKGPELLKGVWRENGEEFSWHLCRANCRQPPP